MRALALILLLIAFPAAAGELVARNGADEARIKDGPCVHAGTLALIPPADREQFHPARGLFKGQDFFGCWRAIRGSVHIVWEDGDQDVLDPQRFESVQGI